MSHASCGGSPLTDPPALLVTPAKEHPLTLPPIAVLRQTIETRQGDRTDGLSLRGPRVRADGQLVERFPRSRVVLARLRQMGCVPILLQ
jgi:hypothetical protein